MLSAIKCVYNRKMRVLNITYRLQLYFQVIHEPIEMSTQNFIQIVQPSRSYVIKTRTEELYK